LASKAEKIMTRSAETIGKYGFTPIKFEINRNNGSATDVYVTGFRKAGSQKKASKSSAAIYLERCPVLKNFNIPTI